MKIKILLSVSFLLLMNIVKAQETLPIYQDYLSDNVFLVHPAAAGIGECAKIRLTAGTQWLGVNDAPQLQTASFHAKVREDAKAGYGVILFNDKNGHHSQKAIQGTYAYHLELDQQRRFNQLSFGLSLAAVQNDVDQRAFVDDPAVSQIIESDFYFNADFGMAYHYGGFSSYLTIKNIFLTAKNNLKSEFNALNLRNYVLGAGYFFGEEEKIQFEPSFMFQYKEQTSEKTLDVNFKAYKKFRQAQLWGAISYRRSFDGSVFDESSYISPILGVNFDRFMIAYTYTSQLNEVKLTQGGFHQISLGYNFLCRKRRLAACPNINAQLF